MFLIIQIYQKHWKKNARREGKVLKRENSRTKDNGKRKEIETWIIDWVKQWEKTLKLRKRKKIPQRSENPRKPIGNNKNPQEVDRSLEEIPKVIHGLKVIEEGIRWKLIGDSAITIRTN